MLSLKQQFGPQKYNRSFLGGLKKLIGKEGKLGLDQQLSHRF
jgi:hypothetical protein